MSQQTKTNAAEAFSKIGSAADLLTGLSDEGSGRVNEIACLLSDAQDNIIKTEHEMAELQTQIVLLKAINKELEAKMQDVEYWKARIRSECGLVEGEEFSRTLGFFKKTVSMDKAFSDLEAEIQKRNYKLRDDKNGLIESIKGLKDPIDDITTKQFSELQDLKQSIFENEVAQQMIYKARHG